MARVFKLRWRGMREMSYYALQNLFSIKGGCRGLAEILRLLKTAIDRNLLLRSTRSTKNAQHDISRSTKVARTLSIQHPVATACLLKKKINTKKKKKT